MTSPIETIAASGSILYAIIHNPNGQVWNALTQAWEIFNAGNWAACAVALTEQGASGYYSAAYPAAIGSSVLTTEVLYQANGTPAIGDAPMGISQSQGENVGAIGGDADAAGLLRDHANVIARGSAIAGTLSTTQMSTNLPSSKAGNYVSRTVVWYSGVLAGQVSNIVAYNGAGLLTFGQVTDPPAPGDSFLII